MKAPMRFELATHADEAALRHILHSEAMPGNVVLATTREPHFFAAGDALGTERVVLARDTTTGQYNDEGSQTLAVGMCYWRDQRVHVQGRACTAHYLGGLRVLPSHQRRIGIVRGGFAAVRAHGPGSPALWYTSVSADNANARRLLEANLKGLPRYSPMGRLWTMALPTGGRGNGFWSPVQADQLNNWCEVHNQYAAAADFSAAVSPAYMQQLKLQLYAHWQGGQMRATLAVWPQNAFKQVRVLRYGRAMRGLRPLYNAWAWLRGGARLPAQGQALDASYAAFWAMAPGLPVADALRDAASHCATPWLFAAVPAGTALGPFARARRQETLIYHVMFDGDAPLTRDARPVWPEVAWL